MNPWVIIGFIAALGVAAAGGYWKGHHDADQSAKVADLTQQVSDQKALVKAQGEEIARINTLNDQLHASDKSHTKELANVRAENERLRADYGPGGKRLHIDAVCHPDEAGAQQGSGMAYAGTCEPSPEVRQDIWDLRGIIGDQYTALKACRDRVLILDANQ